MMPPVQVNITGPRTPGCKQMEPKNEVEQNIQVVIRCRPLNDTERKSQIEFNHDRNEVKVVDRNRVFTYDDVFDQSTNQIEVYRSVVEPLIHQVLDGYNCTVFAYGQTGTGKTFTMEGDRSDLECSWEDDPRSGIIPRAVHQLFEDLGAGTNENEHTVSVTFMELYNEELYDMLSPNEEITKLKIYDDTNKKGRVIVGGLAEVTVHSKAEIYEILRKGSAKRQTAATKLNACSSRSHTIFTVTIRVKECSIDGEDLIKIGKLNLVDLAGSENIGRSGAIEKRAREAGNINQSLLTLGRVITSLVDHCPHIPYRESKLTRLLRDSLGGGTKTSIIATISPNQLDLEDTLSTLEYAARAKRITNKPEINQRLSKKTLLREYTNEIEKLRREIEACRGGSNAFCVDKGNYDQMLEQIDAQHKEIETKEANMKVLKEEMEKLSELFANTQAELDEKKEKLEETSDKLVKTENHLTKTTQNLKVVAKDRHVQKYFVSAHVETEKVLSEQATQLLDVARTTTDHISKLHDKVDRQSTIGSNNLSNVENYSIQFKTHMQKLSELVENSNRGHLDELETSIKTKYCHLLYSLKSAIEKVDISKQTWSKQFVVLENKMKEDEGISTGLAMTLEKSAQLANLVFANDSNVKSEVETLLSTIMNSLHVIMEDVTQQRNSAELLLMKQTEHISSTQDKRHKLLTEVKVSLESMFRNQQTETLELKNKIHLLESQLETKTKKSEEEMNDMEGLLETLTKRFCDLKSTRQNDAAELSNSLLEIRTSLEGSVATSKKHETITSKQVDECSLSLQQCDNESLGIVNEFDSLINRNIQTNVDSLQKACEVAVMKQGDFLESVDNKSKDVQVLFGNLSTLQTGLASIVESSIAGREKELDVTKSVINEQFDNIAVHANDTIKTSNEANENIVKDIAVMKIHYRGAQKNMQKEIKARIEDSENLVKKQLVKDTPTGQTPQKTSYAFPSDLARTSPHERLLERCQANMSDISLEILTEVSDTSESERLSDLSASSNDAIENLAPNGAKLTRHGSKGSLVGKKNTSGSNLKKGVLLTKSKQALHPNQQANC